jgi:hypothetical protein
LVYSAVATFGIHRFTALKDVVPLVSSYESAPYQLCTPALMGLLLSGVPADNLSAYDSVSGELLPWTAATPIVGLLSGSEKELRIRICDQYKFPSSDGVFVLHGRDHFTTCFVVPDSVLDLPNESLDSSSKSKSKRFLMVHLNGLPPSGPKASRMLITAPEGDCKKAPPNAIQGVGVDYRPVPGSIDSIVQADRDDKQLHPKEWTKWKFEVALAIDDPNDVSEVRPSHLPQPKIFNLNVSDIDNYLPWRCRACYQVKQY